jgi:hypothetical protein
MTWKELTLFLGLQLLAIAVAGLAFSMIESRLVAGAVAGSYFVFSGLYMVLRTSRYAGKWHLIYWYPLLVHVFVISIPMVVTRFLNAGRPFEEVHILGLEGPVFHRLSTSVFSLLILGTLIDIARLKRTERSAQETSATR